MQPAQEHQTQAAFARDMGVSRAAVSQWKKRDILRDDAFTQPNKKGLIVVSIAKDQVRRNRDIGQALGNGIGTRTSADVTPLPGEPEDAARDCRQPELPNATVAPADRPGAASELPKTDTVEDQLKRAKLEQQLRTNRIQASDEALRQGVLMDAADAREKMTRLATMMMQIFEGSMPDLAAAISAQFDVPQRDVLHLLRAEFKKVRASASKKERARAEAAEKERTAVVGLE